MYKVTHVESGHDYWKETVIGPFDSQEVATAWIESLKWEGLVEGDLPSGEGFDFHVEDLDGVMIGFVITADDAPMWSPEAYALTHPTRY